MSTEKPENNSMDEQLSSELVGEGLEINPTQAENASTNDSQGIEREFLTQEPSYQVNPDDTPSENTFNEQGNEALVTGDNNEDSQEILREGGVSETSFESNQSVESISQTEDNPMEPIEEEFVLDMNSKAVKKAMEEKNRKLMEEIKHSADERQRAFQKELKNISKRKTREEKKKLKLELKTRKKAQKLAAKMAKKREKEAIAQLKATVDFTKKDSLEMLIIQRKAERNEIEQMGKLLQREAREVNKNTKFKFKATDHRSNRDTEDDLESVNQDILDETLVQETPVSYENFIENESEEASTSANEVEVRGDNLERVEVDPNTPVSSEKEEESGNYTGENPLDADLAEKVDPDQLKNEIKKARARARDAERELDRARKENEAARKRGEREEKERQKSELEAANKIAQDAKREAEIAQKAAKAAELLENRRRKDEAKRIAKEESGSAREELESELGGETEGKRRGFFRRGNKPSVYLNEDGLTPKEERRAAKLLAKSNQKEALIARKLADEAALLEEREAEVLERENKIKEKEIEIANREVARLEKIAKKKKDKEDAKLAKEAKIESDRLAKEAKIESDRLAKEAKIESDRLAKEAKISGIEVKSEKDIDDKNSAAALKKAKKDELIAAKERLKTAKSSELFEAILRDKETLEKEIELSQAIKEELTPQPEVSEEIKLESEIAKDEVISVSSIASTEDPIAAVGNGKVVQDELTMENSSSESEKPNKDRESKIESISDVVTNDDELAPAEVEITALQNPIVTFAETQLISSESAVEITPEVEEEELTEEELKDKKLVKARAKQKAKAKKEAALLEKAKIRTEKNAKKMQERAAKAKAKLEKKAAELEAKNSKNKLSDVTADESKTKKLITRASKEEQAENRKVKKLEKQLIKDEKQRLKTIASQEKEAAKKAAKQLAIATKIASKEEARAKAAEQQELKNNENSLKREVKELAKAEKGQTRSQKKAEKAAQKAEARIAKMDKVNSEKAVKAKVKATQEEIGQESGNVRNLRRQLKRDEKKEAKALKLEQKMNAKRQAEEIKAAQQAERISRSQKQVQLTEQAALNSRNRSVDKEAERIRKKAENINVPIVDISPLSLNPNSGAKYTWDVEAGSSLIREIDHMEYDLPKPLPRR